MKHLPSLMVWGAITAAGPCGLEIFGKDLKVNAAKYIEVLKANIKMHMRFYNFSAGLRTKPYGKGGEEVIC